MDESSPGQPTPPPASRPVTSRTEFLAVMSHELRTPLAAIGGYAEILELEIHGPVNPAQREVLNRIRRSQQHLLGLLNTVLDYARVESRSVRYEIGEVHLDEVAATAEAMIMPQMRSKDLSYSFHGCDEALRVRADAEKVRQILTNLLSNAVKFTPRGGRITITCERHPYRERVITVTVADTGRGIPSEQLNRIFEPFVQLDQFVARSDEGVGLGLAISRELARGMGGDIDVESQVNVGSRFTLVLPAID
jgi:signal transduction histidine kinase